MIKINEDNLLNSVIIGSVLLASILSIIGYFLFSRAFGFGLAAGAGIAILNFVWQRNIMQRVLCLQVGRPKMYALLRYLLRLSITALLLYYILKSGFFSVAGLLIGLSVIVLVIVICTIYFAIQHKGD